MITTLSFKTTNHYGLRLSHFMAQITAIKTINTGHDANAVNDNIKLQ
jgi:hypothetical protein